MAKNNKARIRINYLYPTYKFRKGEQDPVVDRIRTAIDDRGAFVRDIAKKSLVAPSTIYAWLDGTTRFPRYATVAAVMGAMGYPAPAWEEVRKKVAKTESKVLDIRAVA